MTKLIPLSILLTSLITAGCGGGGSSKQPPPSSVSSVSSVAASSVESVASSSSSETQSSSEVQSSSEAQSSSETSSEAPRSSSVASEASSSVESSHSSSSESLSSSSATVSQPSSASLISSSSSAVSSSSEASSSSSEESSSSSEASSSSSEESSSSSEASSSSSEESSSSSEASSSSSSSIAPPAAPQNVIATAGSGSISLSWNPVAGADAYDLFYATETGVTPDNYASLLDGQAVLNVTSPHPLNGLTNGTSYYLVLIAKSAGGESPASAEASAMPVLPPVVATGLLNDTGIDWCANATTNNLSCPVAGFAGQDGDHGRDAQARAGTLVKVGGGAAGFDFTKLNASGNPLPASATSWSCVRDNHTGLIWEVKTTDGGLRDRNNTYTWYNPDNSVNGGFAGYENGGNCTGSACDTHAYVQAVNAQGLCGASDWRLPDINQLKSIVHSGRVNPTIDETYFPNTPSGLFWSSSPGAYNSDGAWIVNFSFGYDVIYLKFNSNSRARLVRSGQ